VRDDLGGPIGWEFGFLAFCALLVISGVLLARSAAQANGHGHLNKRTARARCPKLSGVADEKIQPSAPEDSRQLTGREWTAGVESERRPGIGAEISNAMVGLKKQFYGKGPTKARTYINDNYILCVLQGGLTRNEETLIAAGEEDLVRSYRLRFQEVVSEAATDAIERITARKVIGYHSQITFEPEHAFEIFVLDRPLSGV